MAIFFGASEEFRPDLVQVVFQKDSTKMTKKLRSAFIAQLYDHIARYTMLLGDVLVGGSL